MRCATSNFARVSFRFFILGGACDSHFISLPQEMQTLLMFYQRAYTFALPFLDLGFAFGTDMHGRTQVGKTHFASAVCRIPRFGCHAFCLFSNLLRRIMISTS